MRRQRETAAEQDRGDVDAGVEVIRRAICHDSSGRDTDEGVDHVPDAVDVRDLVGKKLDNEQPARDTDDPPVIEHVEPAGQLCKAKLLDQPEYRDRGVEIYAAGPGGAEGETKCREPFH